MANPPSNKLFIGGLTNVEVTRGDVARSFEQFGEVTDVNVQYPPTGGAGYAFVEFRDDRSALDALRACEGRQLFGCSVRLEFAKARRRGRETRPPPPPAAAAGRHESGGSYASGRDHRGYPPPDAGHRAPLRDDRERYHPQRRSRSRSRSRGRDSYRDSRDARPARDEQRDARDRGRPEPSADRRGSYDRGGDYYDRDRRGGAHERDRGRGGYGGRHGDGYDRPREGSYERGGYDRSGHGRGAYDRAEYDRGGYDRGAYDRGAYDRGYDRGGYDRAAYDRRGHDPVDYDRGAPERGRRSYDRVGSGYDRDDRHSYRSGADDRDRSSSYSSRRDRERGHDERARGAYDGGAPRGAYARPDRAAPPPRREPRRGGGVQHTEWVMLVDGMPEGSSWQDLKDYIRKEHGISEMGFAEIRGTGASTVGVVHLQTETILTDALRKMEGATMYNRHGKTGKITVRRDGGSGTGGEREVQDNRGSSEGSKNERSGGNAAAPVDAGDTDRRPSQSRSPSRSKSRSRSRSASRSRSPSASGPADAATDNDEGDGKGDGSLNDDEAQNNDAE
eukprot:INCI5340.2.p1 GENE.INCI5340.2~~INCI5340.2.p1  ORF type:complete len:561 (-),score=53.08 INCI5340.2:921-2603(-)